LTERKQNDDKNIGLGLTLEEAKSQLDSLIQQKQETLSALEKKGQAITIETIGLQQRLQRIQDSIDRTRDWYGIQVMESLEKSSKSLNRFTKVLIVLTIVLAGLTAILAIGHL
jgi:hypothetical protein